MSENKREAILARIKKLMAITREGSNASQGEIENAQALASKLLKQYNLDIVEVLMTGEGDKDALKIDHWNVSPWQGEQRRYMDIWRNQLMGTIARHNFCSLLLSGNMFTIVGAKMNIELVVQMYYSVANQLTILCDREFARYETMARYQRTTPKTWKNSWLMGAVVGLNERLDLETKAEQAKGTMALTVFYDQAIDKYKNSHWKINKASSSGPERQFSPSAAALGRAAGSEIQGRRGLTDKQPNKQIK